MARYVLVEIYPEDHVDTIIQEVISTFKKILGLRIIRGYLRVVKKKGNRVVFKVSTNLLPYLRACTILIRQINDSRVIVLTVRISGTIRKICAQLDSIPKLLTKV